MFVRPPGAHTDARLHVVCRRAAAVLARDAAEKEARQARVCAAAAQARAVARVEPQQGHVAAADDGLHVVTELAGGS
jgi:hypothetical protein